MRQAQETREKRSRVPDGTLVELEYDARVKETGMLVDTTEPGDAEDLRIPASEAGPAVAIVGLGHLFTPIEERLKREGPGWSGTVEVPPEASYGHPDPDDRTRIPTRTVPEGSREPGAKVLLDGRCGFVEKIDGGEATVNFNHPLAGLTLRYEVKGSRVLDGTADKLDGLLRLHGLDDTSEADVDDGCLVLRSSLGTRRTAPSGARKGFVRDAFRLLDVETVRIVETYERDRRGTDERTPPRTEGPGGGETR